MSSEEWVDYYRNMKPIKRTIDADVEGMILSNMEKMLAIIKPPDENQIREHVIKTLTEAPYTRYCGD